MAEWHPPVDINNYGPSSSSSKEVTERKTTSNVDSATIFQPLLSTADAIFDYALLHLTAESAILRLQLLPAKNGKKEASISCPFVPVTVSLSSGKDIGSIDIPISALSDENKISTHEIEGEFIVLSSIPSKGDDGDEISEPRYNIMLLS